MPTELFSLTGTRVWVAGHRGMVGSALVRRLERENCQILLSDKNSVNLTNQRQTRDWLDSHRPDVIFVAAAKVGGILANECAPVDFLYDNLMIELNIIEAAHRVGVRKLLFLGSSCIYPKMASQPIIEESLLTGPLEPTNEWYAVAKIAGLKLCQAYRRQYGADFISAMPTNLFGPGDNFDLESSHVIPALIRKVSEAKAERRPEVVIWGTGEPRREFLHVDDCADALVHLIKFYSGDQHVNVGSGIDLTILELAELIAEIVGYCGRIVRDTSKPDGTPRKLMSADRMRALGWVPRISLRDGLRATYDWYVERIITPAVRQL
jgi:GDP-L-fucose synthase